MLKKLTTNEFIEKAHKVHGDKYDYSKVEYINTMTKVCIICPTHGDFWQTPNNHLKGKGCAKCSHQSYKYTLNDFIKTSNKIHNNKYDYSKVEYVNNSTKVCIICPIHGEFFQAPTSHLKGYGCKKCADDLNKTNQPSQKTNETFLMIHGNKYEYLTPYINAKTKLIIKCLKCGNVFEQSPHKHINSKHGCPLCNESHLERDVRLFLQENNIQFEQQKRFDWLGLQSLDFYLPEYNTAIECQGGQHFESVELFGGEDALKETIERDKRKLQLCNENNIKLLYYSTYNKINLPNNIIQDKEKLLSNILND